MTSCSNELSVSGDHVGIGCRNSSSSISSKSLQTNIRSSRNPLAVLELEAMLLIPSIQVAQKEKLVSTLLKQGTSSYVLVVRPCSWFHEYVFRHARHYRRIRNFTYELQVLYSGTRCLYCSGASRHHATESANTNGNLPSVQLQLKAVQKDKILYRIYHINSYIVLLTPPQ